MNDKINVACLGAGYFSRFHYDAWHRIAQVNLLASCDHDLPSAVQTGLQGFSQLDHMLSEISIDVLDIITPPTTHLSAIRQAIAANVPLIICQKPFCTSLEEAESVVAEASAANACLVVHENFRFQPWFRKMYQALNERQIGDVQQASFRLRTGDGQGPDAYLDRQPYFQSMERFLVHETGIHYLDTFRFLFGEPDAVYADLRRLNPAIAGEDAGIIVLDFPSQLRATFDGNRHLDFDADDTRLTFGEAWIEGTDGCLYLGGDGRLVKRAFGQRGLQTLLEPQAWKGFAGDCVFALQQHVVDHLLTGSRLENQAGQYLKTLELERLVYESAGQSRKLQVR